MRTATVAALLALLFAASAIAPVAAADRDKDGLRDGFETRYGVTSPDKRDSDGDGVIDSAEDNDGDKLGNLGEQRFGTDPGERDTDDDGIPDGKEDKDRDGRSNAREQDRRPLPKGLKPSLARAKYDLPSDRKRCANLADRGAALVRCAFGPADAETTIALLGDSHALAWLPAVRAAAEQEGWRLVTLLKGSCSPVLGTIKADNWSTDRNRSCSAWRQKALEWLGSHPVDLVIITHADDARLVTRRDGPSRAPSGPRFGSRV